MNLREWTAAAVEPGGQDPPDPDEWVAVEGPEHPARFADERAVAYRTQFADPGDARSQLRLDGLYAHARIWLDGDLLGEHDAYFEPFRAVVDSAGEHELVVVCRAPDDRFGGVFETDHVSPRERVPGIRWGATIEPVPEVALTDLTIRPDDGDETGIDVIVTVDAAVDFSGRVRLSLHPEGSDATSGMTQVGVSADAGERVTVQGRLSVRDPDRWWPRGFGSPHRYTVRASLANHERTATTGFRTVAYDSSGLSVNGARIPVRGRVVLPTTDPDDAVTAVERAAETNATLVRWYGHAPPEAAYAAADEAGVLLMQDLPMSPGALDVERARSVARRLSGAYGHHASLALFGVHDDAHAFETTTDRKSWRVCRAVGGREHAATATTAASALSGAMPVLAVPGLDAESERNERLGGRRVRRSDGRPRRWYPHPLRGSRHRRHDGAERGTNGRGAPADRHAVRDGVRTAGRDVRRAHDDDRVRAHDRLPRRPDRKRTHSDRPQRHGRLHRGRGRVVGRRPGRNARGRPRSGLTVDDRNDRPAGGRRRYRDRAVDRGTAARNQLSPIEQAERQCDALSPSQRLNGFCHYAQMPEAAGITVASHTNDTGLSSEQSATDEERRPSGATGIATEPWQAQ